MCKEERLTTPTLDSHKGVSACIKAYSFEHLYYVTLYGENGIDLKHLFVVHGHCLASSHMQVSPTGAQEQLDSAAEELESPPAPPVDLMYKGLGLAPVVGVLLMLGAFHDVQVSHLRDPSEFWLQLHEHRQLFRQLRQSMWNFYSHAMKPGGSGWDLQPGSLCCVSGKEKNRKDGRTKAIQAFREFVDTSSSYLGQKCTIFALVSINNKELFNIVDVMTPFQSACQFLTGRGVARPLSPQKPLVSSVQVHSYYYSTHGIKIGNEEDVYIMHIKDPWMFYCQLERCADVLAQLGRNIGRLSEKMTSLETWQGPGSLCLAKYTDGHWYRGLIKKTKPNREVVFVDFGNTETIERDHLLPLPRDACDVLVLPMQAIKCSLSDIPNVPKEATTWFKQAVLERQLKDSDGQLLIELFDGNTKFSAKLKEKLSLTDNTGPHRHIENETLCSRNTEEPSPRRLSSSGCRPEKQLDLKTHDKTTTQRTVCTEKSCDYRDEKRKEWQKKKYDCYVEEWMKQDLTDSFEECGNSRVQSSACKPGYEEVEKKQNENLADCGAEEQMGCGSDLAEDPPTFLKPSDTFSFTW
ncbi:LOW QUALITY PROTEIN: tudor domain-containing protein 6 [Aegotheles albertisi]